jgi:hypothetical protein
MLRSTRPPKCKFCKERTEKVGMALHLHCVDGWWAKEREKKARAMDKKLAEIRRKDRAETRAKLDGFKRLSTLEAECREIVQEIARIRDRNDGCISCHMGANYGGRWHGSHFRPAGNNSAVQFHLDNIHKACAQCNLFKGGNVTAYRPRLVEKIGEDRVKWLESQNHTVKYTREYLLRFKRVMGKRLRRMKKRSS